jgi:aminopeptidase-like protein
MNLMELPNNPEVSRTGQEMYDLIAELYPICRSITGNGVRRTLGIISKHIGLQIHEVRSGIEVFDWTVPKEWNIRKAFVKNSRNEKVVDFQESNLHVVSYSVPIHQKMSLPELKQHLFSMPDHPDWIPYRTSYYKETWGFCLAHNQLMQLQDGEYEVLIDSSLEDGHLTYGEYFIPGKRTDEVLISCHVCHPSLCNDNLSGIALSTFLAKYLSACSTEYSYRFLFIPGTIGAITWLSLNEARVTRIKHGLVVACVGDSGQCTYKKSRRGDAEIDKAVAHVLKHSGQDYEILEFSPYGYDERQYCSPGFNLAVGSLTRTPHGRFPQYHTSADNVDFIQPEFLRDSFLKYFSVIKVLENNKRYRNTNPKCEPQLGKRGLYNLIGGRKNSEVARLALLWVLNLSDGHHTLLDIAEKAEVKFDHICHAANLLQTHGLVEEA